MKTENKDESIEKDPIIHEKEGEEKIESEQEVNENEANQDDAKNKESNESEEKEHNLSIEDLIQERNEINDKYVRLAAEFSNYKRRTENEKKDIYSYANERIVSDLLNVLDNFERALASMETGNSGSLMDGVNMIFKQLNEVLENHGLSEIKSHQCEFDPNFHHAVMKENVEGVDSNMIIQVLQKGYSLNGKVVRPSMVKVAE